MTAEQKSTEALQSLLADGVTLNQIFDALKELAGPTASMDMWTMEDFKGVLYCPELTDEQAAYIAKGLLEDDHMKSLIFERILARWRETQ